MMITLNSKKKIIIIIIITGLISSFSQCKYLIVSWSSSSSFDQKWEFISMKKFCTKNFFSSILMLNLICEYTPGQWQIGINCQMFLLLLCVCVCVSNVVSFFFWFLVILVWVFFQWKKIYIEERESRNVYDYQMMMMMIMA